MYKRVRPHRCPPGGRSDLCRRTRSRIRRMPRCSAPGRLGQRRLRRRPDDLPGVAGGTRTPRPSSSRSRFRPASSSARPSSRPTARTRSSRRTAATSPSRRAPASPRASRRARAASRTSAPTAAPATDVTTLDGGEASFCPDGRRVAFLRVPAVRRTHARAGRGRRRGDRGGTRAAPGRRSRASSRAPGASSCATSTSGATKRSTPAIC